MYQHTRTHIHAYSLATHTGIYGHIHTDTHTYSYVRIFIRTHIHTYTLTHMLPCTCAHTVPRRFLSWRRSLSSLPFWASFSGLNSRISGMRVSRLFMHGLTNMNSLLQWEEDAYGPERPPHADRSQGLVVRCAEIYFT
jgi:hypothetical protein